MREIGHFAARLQTLGPQYASLSRSLTMLANQYASKAILDRQAAGRSAEASQLRSPANSASFGAQARSTASWKLPDDAELVADKRTMTLLRAAFEAGVEAAGREQAHDQPRAAPKKG